jgi:ribosomal protein S18 acetylase RimI-like enzyme
MGRASQQGLVLTARNPRVRVAAMATQIPSGVRAVDPFDWPGVLALIQRAFAGMEGRIDPPSSLHRLTAGGIAAQAMTGEVWVVPPMQACMFLTPKQGRLYLGKLAVEPALQGRGLARLLVALAEERARAMGLAVLELETRIELTENHAIFARLGFVETGRKAHPGFDRPTSITFAKQI